MEARVVAKLRISSPVHGGTASRNLVIYSDGMLGWEGNGRVASMDLFAARIPIVYDEDDCPDEMTIEVAEVRDPMPDAVVQVKRELKAGLDDFQMKVLRGDKLFYGDTDGER